MMGNLHSVGLLELCLQLSKKIARAGLHICVLNNSFLVTCGSVHPHSETLLLATCRVGLMKLMLSGGIAGLLNHMVTKLEAEMVASNSTVTARCQALLDAAELKLLFAMPPRWRTYASAYSSGHGVFCYIARLLAASL